MTERKVLNKYYPPDFDPSKLPKLKRGANRQFCIRTMAPFNMRCNTCGEYIYKAKKFNARQEKVEGESYLGLHIFRFYIRCTRCLAEITFKTDPETTDYVMESGATRNFDAKKIYEEQLREEEKAKAEADADDPMRLLEERTRMSRKEMEAVEELEDLRELKNKQAQLDMDNVVEKHQRETESLEAREIRRQEEEDEAFVQSIFGKKGDYIVKRIEDDDDTATQTANKRGAGDSDVTQNKLAKLTDNSDVTKSGVSKASFAPAVSKPAQTAVWNRSVGSFSGGGSLKSKLGGMIIKKKKK